MMLASRALLFGTIGLAVQQQALALEAITLKQRPDGSRVFVDPTGRQKIFHGTGAVVKGPPWHPDTRNFDSRLSMVAEDFVLMQSLGLNLLRLGVMWPGVEPVRGQYNDTYLDEISKIVDVGAAHGVYTLLDMHQDGLSEYYCGEGLPTWAVKFTQRTWLSKIEDWVFSGPAFPSPFSHYNESTDFYRETRLPSSPRFPTHRACWDKKDHSYGPGFGEGTKQSSDSYQALYKNVDGIGDAWASMWAKVAQRFQGRPEVLGLELINEPFAGDVWTHPTIIVPYPNPWNADAYNLQPAYDRLNKAIRSVDEDVLIFFAGVTTEDWGAGFTAAPGGPAFANRSVLAFHYYHPPQKTPEAQFASQGKSASRLGTGSFMTETETWSAGDVADDHLQSWARWEWKTFNRGCSEVSQNCDWGSGKTGNGDPWHGDAPPADSQDKYARTYAPTIAGDLVSVSFNTTSAYFQLVYDIGESVPTHPTEIFAWPARYPNGMIVNAASNKGKVLAVYKGQGLFEVRAASGLEPGARVVVTIRKKPLESGETITIV